MFLSKKFKAALSVAALTLLSTAVSSTGHAVPVQHDGSIFAVSGGGVSFSFLHKSTNGTGGGSILSGNNLSGDGKQIVGDISYTWDTPSGNLEPGATITFDRGATMVFDDGNFQVSLFTSSSVMTVGAEDLTHGTIGGVQVTHDISGEINFTITQLTGSNAGAMLSDTFNFAPDMQMGPINGIGSAGGTPESFNTYVWGDTGAFDGGCDTGSCTDILDRFYAANGLGIDIAFSGLQVSEPGILGLFGIGLLGLGFARRRRQKFA